MVRARLLSLRRDERGFTLVEQLVTLAMLGIVVSAILGLVDMAQRVAPADNERNMSMREAQSGMDRMTRELRHAYSSPTISEGGFKVEANVVLRSQNVAVTYDCSGLAPGSTSQRRCVRRVGAQVVTVLPRIVNPPARPVFTATQRPGDALTTFIRAAAEVPASGERKAGQNHRVVLEDGFYLRNVDASRP